METFTIQISKSRNDNFEIYGKKIRQIEGGSVLLSYFTIFFAVFDDYSFFCYVRIP